WGSDRVGQLGTGGGRTSTPARVMLDSHAVGTAATDHTCWITQGGGRHCWGWNGNGQLGLGTVESTAYDLPTEGPDGDPSFAALDAGWYFTCGLTRDRRIWCWGSNDRGQSGVDPGVDDPVPTPTAVDDATDWASIAAGGFHACATKSDGTLWCWGM